MSNDPVMDLFGVEGTEAESVELHSPFKAEEATESSDEALIASILSTPTDPVQLGILENELFLDTGHYVWVDGKCEVRVNFSDKDIAQGDLAVQKGLKGKGRCYISLGGMVRNLATGKEGRFSSFGCSPDIRRIEGELDMIAKNYLMVTSYFFKRFERKVSSPQEVVEFLGKGMYQLYITRGKSGGNFLNQLKDL